MPEFATEKSERFINDYQLNENEAVTLASEMELAKYYEQVVKDSGEPKLSSNWVLTEVLRVLKDKNIEISDFIVTPQNISKLINLIKSNVISSKIAKEVFEEMIVNNKDPEEIVKDNGMLQITDSNEIEKIVDQVLNENEQSVEDFKLGKDRALKFLVGQAMKLSKGKANPQMLNKIIVEKISLK